MPGYWEPVGSFDPTGRRLRPFERIDMTLRDASLDCQRFRTAEGERAIVVSARHLVDIAGFDLPGTVGDVLFIDPPSSAVVTSFLASRPQSVASLAVALPAGTAGLGLLRSGGSVVVRTAPEPSRFQLYYRGAPGPKLGEGSDALEGRSKWFESRHTGDE
ncbi:hypothetical protein RR21198_0313 [Rhodococcus rhodochrous ATCC 21198]|nr:hypothetical protein RR21198_0313 [Rhodococcus rhodochrous ATCC 21198]